MKVKTQVKAGGIGLQNHNETLVRDMGKGPQGKDAREGRWDQANNHNETLVVDTLRRR